MLSSDEQPLKAAEPMLVTLFGIVILVSPVHPLKADEPILVTLFGMTMFFMFLSLTPTMLISFGVELIIKSLYSSSISHFAVKFLFSAVILNEYDFSLVSFVSPSNQPIQIYALFVVAVIVTLLPN